MVDSFVFNGKSSTDFHLLISGYGTYRAPSRDVTMKSVAGRDGDLTLDNGRYKNVDITYKGVIYNSLMPNYRELVAWLLTQRGYKRLEDTFNPDEFRLGVFKESIEPKLKGYDAASMQITFNCKPQRYLKIGEEPIEINQTGIVANPTAFESRPLIRAYGSGTLSINSKNLVITGVSANDYIDIDSEIMDAFKGTVNLNSKISGEFPTLAPGDNEITFNGNLEIIPRWFNL